MGLDDQIMFGMEWAIAMSFGITMILLFHSLIFN
jgi:hypothetical protein